MNNTTTTIALSALLATMLAFSGCSDSSSSNSSDTNEVTSSSSSQTTTQTGGEVEVREVSEDTTWTKDKVYKLVGNKVKVKSGVTLTIEAGTTIIAESKAYLLVLKGAKIMAEGTKEEPIIFTSEEAYNGAAEKSAQWGGLTLFGNAQVNEADLKYEVDESDPDFAFGSITPDNNDENSGVLKYVQIRNTGFAVAPDKEVNGLSLCGIGSGTTIDNVTIYNSGDDGIEIWGGTVNLSNITIEGAQDDSLDVDNGYTGTVTNLTIKQTEPGYSLVEMTNSGDASIVRTNVTIDGFSMQTSVNQEKDGGIYFKDADTTGTFKNGTIDMSTSTALEGPLHNKKGVYSSPVFVNVTAKTNGSPLATGDEAGVSVLETAFNSGENNTAK